jgi:hypothetical protein
MTGDLSSKVTTYSTTLLMWIYPTGNGVVVTELGILLNKASVSIKKCDENIERVNVISLNS